MSDALTAVVEARAAYLKAREQVTETRLALGRAIMEARSQNVDQVDIAAELELTREQVRRYQDEYERSIGKKPPVRVDVAQRVRRTIEGMGPEVRGRVGLPEHPKFTSPPGDGES